MSHNGPRSDAQPRSLDASNEHHASGRHISAAQGKRSPPLPMQDHLLTWSTDSYVSFRGVEIFLSSEWGALFASFITALLGLAPLFTTSEAFLGSGTDMPTLQYPQRAFVTSWLHRNIWPLWNHTIFAGGPFQTGSHSLVYFTTLFQYLLPVDWEIKVTFLVHTALAMYFMRCLLFHHAEFHALASFMGGIMYALGGFGMSHAFAGHIDIIVTYPYLPLVFWLWLRALNSNRVSTTIHAALAFALMVQSGHLHVVYISLVGIACFTVAGIIANVILPRSDAEETPYLWVKPWSTETPLSQSVDLVSATLWTAVKALALGSMSAALCAFQLWPYMETVANSQRSSVKSLSFALSHGAPAWDALRFIAPHALGDERGTNPFCGSWSPWEGLGFVSVTALVLASIGYFAPGFSRNRIMITSSMVIAALIAVGDATPFFALYFHIDPLLWRFRAPSRFVLIVSFFVIWLAARGLHVILQTTQPEEVKLAVAAQPNGKSTSRKHEAFRVIVQAAGAVGAIWLVYLWLADTLRLDPAGVATAIKTPIPPLPPNTVPGWIKLKENGFLNEDVILGGMSPMWPSPVVGNAIVRFMLKQFKRAAQIATVVLTLIALLLGATFARHRALAAALSASAVRMIRSITTLLIVIIVFGELLYFGYPYLRTISSENFRMRPEDLNKLRSELRPGARVVMLEHELLNHAGIHDLAEASGYDTFLPASFVRACNYAMKRAPQDYTTQTWSLITGCCSQSLCNALGVSHFVSISHGVNKWTNREYDPQPRAIILQASRIHRQGLAPEWNDSSSALALRDITTLPTKWGERVHLLAKDVENVPPAGENPNFTAKADVVTITPNEMTVKVKVSHSPSVLVTSDVFAPGWRFEVLDQDHQLLDGPNDALSANAGIGRAAVLNRTGEFVVRFFYWPKRLTQGIIVSVATYTTLLLALIIGRVRSSSQKNSIRTKAKME